jgi:hypothetical protein
LRNCKIEELLFSFESAVYTIVFTRLTAQIIKNIAFFPKNTKPTPRMQHVNSIVMKYLPLKQRIALFIQFTSINDEGRK